MFNIYMIQDLIDIINYESNSLFIQFIVTASGTLLGFWGALYISKKEEIKNLNKERQERNNTHKNRLKYLCLLIDSSIKATNDQIIKFEELTAKIDKEPFERPILNIIANNDLKRLKSMDTEDLFQAYFNIIKNNNIKDYKNLFNNIDYLHASIKSNIKAAEKQVMYTYKDQCNIKHNIEELIDNILIQIKDLEKENKKDTSSYNFLNKYYKYYNKFNANDDKEYIITINKTIFLDPFITEIESNRKEYLNSKLHNLATNTIAIFENIKYNNSELVKEINEEIAKIKECISNLETIKENISNSL